MSSVSIFSSWNFARIYQKVCLIKNQPLALSIVTFELM